MFSLFGSRNFRVLIVLSFICLLTFGMIPSGVTADGGQDPPDPYDSIEGGLNPLGESTLNTETDLLLYILTLLL